MADSHPTRTTPENDPHRWLEKDNEEVTTYVEKETARTEAHFQYPQLKSDEQKLLNTLNRSDQLIVPVVRGNNVWEFRKDADHTLGLWRYASLNGFLADTPVWKVGADFDQIAKDQGKQLVCDPRHIYTLPPEHKRALFHLSDSGETATTIHEYDILSCEFVADGFNLPKVKGFAQWIDIDTVIVASSIYGETNQGQADTVRIWKRGQPWEEARPVFTTDKANTEVWCGYGHDDKRAFVCDSRSYFDNDLWFFDPSSPHDMRKLDIPVDCESNWSRDILTLTLRSDWSVNGQVFKTDAVVATRLGAFLDGERDLHKVYRPEPRCKCATSFFSDGSLILEIWDNLVPRFEIVDPDEWSTKPLPGIPDSVLDSNLLINVRVIHAEDSEQDGTIFVIAEGPITPPTLTVTNHHNNDTSVLHKQSLLSAFDTTGLETKIFTANSAGGEIIPYLFCGPSALDKPVPLRIRGYAGFGVVSVARYDEVDGMLWLERGNATVLAYARGGGELGADWHKAGQLAGRRLTNADFAAVARDCVNRGFTLPSMTVGWGGSNGGLIMANLFTDYPDQFAGFVASVPLTDMYRYTEMLGGASWDFEYGKPKEDWNDFLADLSPYHKLESGCNYPSILIVTGRRDDHVHPAHGRKFFKKLQVMDCDEDQIFLYETEGGHMGRETFPRYAHDSVLLYEFMRRVTSPKVELVELSRGFASLSV